MIRLIEMVYGRVLMPDTEEGFQGVVGSKSYENEHAFMLQAATLLQQRERGIALDVGANYGYWSLALAPFADQVIAIEPQRAIFNMLCGTVALNDLSYVVFPHLLAAGPEARMDEIAILDYAHAGSFGGLRVGKDPSPPDCISPFKVIGSEPVQVVRIDDCLDPKRRVSFIKMDIEGSEIGALAGAVATIRKWRPPMFIEYCHSRTNKSQLLNQIEEMGYETRDMKCNFLCLPR